jgi:hypothetical protein
MKFNCLFDGSNVKHHERRVSTFFVLSSGFVKVTSKLEVLEPSILSKAFQGELGTNDLSEESAIEILKELLQEQVK